VGRLAELEAVHRFLETSERGAGTLVLEGDAGIGKTTVWRAGIDMARSAGCEILAARPWTDDAGLSYASLADLFADIPEAIVTARQ